MGGVREGPAEPPETTIRGEIDVTPNRRRLIVAAACGGLVLLNLVLGIILYRINAEALIGMAPIAILVPVAQYRMIDSWGRGHSFLKGFVWSAWPVAVSFLWGIAHPVVRRGAVAQVGRGPAL